MFPTRVPTSNIIHSLLSYIRDYLKKKKIAHKKIPLPTKGVIGSPLLYILHHKITNNTSKICLYQKQFSQWSLKKYY
jgi:hypothetical protein